MRASNTNPYLTLRFEGPSEAQIAEMKRVIYGACSATLRDAPRVATPPRTRATPDSARSTARAPSARTGQSREPQHAPGSMQDGGQAGRARADHVDRVEIAHVDGLGGRQPGPLQRNAEDARIGLLDADLGRVDDEVQMTREAESSRIAAHRAVGVRDARRAQTAGRASVSAASASGSPWVHSPMGALYPRRHADSAATVEASRTPSSSRR